MSKESTNPAKMNKNEMLIHIAEDKMNEFDALVKIRKMEEKQIQNLHLIPKVTSIRAINCSINGWYKSCMHKSDCSNCY